jgi:hypothetical protein
MGPSEAFAVPSLKIVHVWEDFSGGNSSKLIDISPVGGAQSGEHEATTYFVAKSIKKLNGNTGRCSGCFFHTHLRLSPPPGAFQRDLVAAPPR